MAIIGRPFIIINPRVARIHTINSAPITILKYLGAKLSNQKVTIKINIS